jgi:hypothetical protein
MGLAVLMRVKKELLVCHPWDAIGTVGGRPQAAIICNSENLVAFGRVKRNAPRRPDGLRNFFQSEITLARAGRPEPTRFTTSN